MSSDISFEQRGCVGLITLQRVKALNALSHDMVKELAAKLGEWKGDDGIKAVILTSASEKAFSAGGDIRALYDGKGNPPFDFFWNEYRLNRAIFRYPKPYISLINGIVMGGGVGISVHGKYVVAGENIMFAMPEVGIGFFPDVGGTYFLPRMKGKVGTYLAMTGARLRQADCAALGFATHATSSENFDAIIDRIAQGEQVEAVLSSYNQLFEPTFDASALDIMNEAFSKPTVLEIVNSLKEKADGHSFAQKALKQLDGKSPTSIHVGLAQVLRGAKADFEECMALEYRIVHRILHEEDFYEGVRATIVDKDGAPEWNPAELESVDPAKIEAHFAPLENGELTFDEI
ncbi:enoyl-CoA hydratase/isomerase family protein [Cohaesibacter gelatinilyticus]|uniref:3-hydroxyisobutyryl-CoA hydrolase n=1 Tax=Cohaesibacter gelatinilyticus TaxID=372072 RepID=A0A285ND35_9HYPH|nr:enoyl-CoA hydratase/isomerase family protein [Cohaesibacter gelatinilyticus]SNZ07339.1 enoyl-CoA hydratase [Cohaesibacter gelatinilyticus]